MVLHCIGVDSDAGGDVHGVGDVYDDAGGVGGVGGVVGGLYVMVVVFEVL